MIRVWDRKTDEKRTLTTQGGRAVRVPRRWHSAAICPGRQGRPDTGSSGSGSRDGIAALPITRPGPPISVCPGDHSRRFAHRGSLPKLERRARVRDGAKRSARRGRRLGVRLGEAALHDSPCRLPPSPSRCRPTANCWPPETSGEASASGPCRMQSCTPPSRPATTESRAWSSGVSRAGTSDQAAETLPWQLAVGDAGGIVTMLDLHGKRIRNIGRGSREDVKTLDFSPDGTMLASAGRYRAKVWDVATGRLIARDRRRELSARPHVLTHRPQSGGGGLGHLRPQGRSRSL